jgi:hypothetical protein
MQKKNPTIERNKMKKIFIIAALATGLWCAQAYAFTGNVVMGSSDGNSNLTVSNGGGSTTLTFGANWSVSSGNGVYTGAAGAGVTYTGFTYTTATGVITAPAAPFQLWSFVSGGNTFTFKLDSPIKQNSNTATFFQITGVGTGFVNGVDPTRGTWSLTGNGAGVSFQFVSSSVNVFVPDGGSAVALLGIALTGIEALRRRIGARKE